MATARDNPHLRRSPRQASVRGRLCSAAGPQTRGPHGPSRDTRPLPCPGCSVSPSPGPYLSAPVPAVWAEPAWLPSPRPTEPPAPGLPDSSPVRARPRERPPLEAQPATPPQPGPPAPAPVPLTGYQDPRRRQCFNFPPGGAGAGETVRGPVSPGLHPRALWTLSRAGRARGSSGVLVRSPEGRRGTRGAISTSWSRDAPRAHLHP